MRILNIVMIFSQLSYAISAKPEEMDECRRWVATKFDAKIPEPPFSFTYGDSPFAELLKTWELERSHKKLDDQRIEHTLTYTDPKTSLVARCVSIEYHDFPTVEWTVYLTNKGAVDTPILADIQALDMYLERSPEREFILHHHVGSICAQNDYEPLKTILGPGKEECIIPWGGRSSNGNFPYFNLEWAEEGTIVVLGWPGQWKAQFTRNEETKLRIRAGQELTHFKLYPGEEVRTPLIVLQFWKEDRIRAQNIWRRWMLAHNVPRPDGKLPSPQWNASSSLWFEEMSKADEASQKLFIDRYLEEGLTLDYWWMDAGWYPCDGWPNTGTWEVDTKRFPRGLRAVTDHAHVNGLKCIVWFEPERVTPGTWLYENHPEWLLGSDGGTKLLNLGNSDAWQWLTDHIDKLITEQGIDLYRQDFNIEPLDYWRANDAEDRQGITEIRYVMGFLSYWDELRRRHPGLLIDTCASGGRRNDLETLRRAVPLHRSDYCYEPAGQQCHTYGLAFWVPFYGAPVASDNPYEIRSTMCPVFTTGWDVRRNDLDYELLRQLSGQWRTIAPYYLGDYYPLTSYSRENTVWIAWQFDRPDLGEGVVQAFRRTGSFYESACFKLRGLLPDARYTLTNFDVSEATEMTGRELMEKGLFVLIENQPGAVVISYKQVKENK